MLKKTQRLSRTECSLVLAQGRRISGAHVSLVYTKGNRETKYAVVVGKKVTPNATNRNKIRRKLYSFCREYGLHLQGIHGIFLTQKGIQKQSLEEQKETISSIFKKVK